MRTKSGTTWLGSWTKLVLIALTAATCTEGNSPDTVFSPDPQQAGKGLYIEVIPRSGTVLHLGESAFLTVIVRDGRGRILSQPQIQWQSSDPGIVKVDAGGRLTGVSGGVAFVRARHETIDDSATVAVTQAQATQYGVQILPDADTIPYVGGSTMLVAAVFNTKGKAQPNPKVTWKSADPDLASVNQEGVVIGLSNGVARITAASGNASDTARVWVAPAAPSPVPVKVTVSPKADTIPSIGGTAQLTALVTDASGAPIPDQTVSWGSLDPTVAYVDANGLITGAASGIARIKVWQGTLVDTATITVGSGSTEGQPASVVVSPATGTINVGTTLRLVAEVLDSNGAPTADQSVTWASLDIPVASVDANGDVTGVGVGIARIAASHGGLADTAWVTVESAEDGGGGGGSLASITITPGLDTVAIGATVDLTVTVTDDAGQPITNAEASWVSLDPGIAVPDVTGTRRIMPIKGVASGTARITATYSGMVDTAQVYVPANGGGDGGDGGGGGGGGGAMVVTATHSPVVPVAGGSVTISAVSSDTAATVSMSISLDGSVVKSCTGGGTCSWSNVFQAAGSHTYEASAQDTAGITLSMQPKTFTVWATPTSGNLTPGFLLPTVGPLIARIDAVPELTTLDNMYPNRELQAWDAWILDQDEIRAHHYDALRSRIQWSIRNGLTWGAGVTSLSEYYGRGRSIIHAYMDNYAVPNSYATPIQNATGLMGEEMLWLLEGHQESWDHIKHQAEGYTTDPYGYVNLTNTASGARIPAMSLQAKNAAHRLGMPYTGGGGHGSWKAAGEWTVARVSTAIQADGTIISPSNGAGTETYFMNAMLATELLRWHGFVEPKPEWVALAQLIIDHLIAELEASGLPHLGYTSASWKDYHCDLAGYYVWPSLVLWQETGDPKYQTFALQNLVALKGAGTGVKQFNQAFSTGTQNAEALLAGVPWR